MASYNLSLKEAAVAFGGATLGTKMKAAAERGLLAAALRLQQHIIADVIPSRLPQPVDRGIYRAAWHVQPIPGGAMISNSAPHASVIEYGRRAGRPVGRRMVQALAEWAKRHGFKVKTIKVDKKGREKVVERRANKDELLHIGWLIANAIKARGLYNGFGLRILEGALRNAQRFVTEEVTREFARTALK